MSDRTSMSVEIYSPDAATLKAVATHIDTFCYVEEVTENPCGTHFYAPGVTLGTSANLADELDALRTTHTDFAYKITESPAYEYLGTLELYSPGQDRFQAECSDSGAVVLTDERLDEITSLEELHEATGRPQREAYARYREALAG